MSVKVLKTKATTKENSSELDFLSNVDASTRIKNKIKDEVGELLLDKILSDVGAAKSPIEGESFPSLSPEYKKFKESQRRPGKANLELTGDMLDALDFNRTTNGIKIGVFGAREAGKADSHNHLGSKGKNPKRRFLPKKGQKFSGSITKEINEIVTDAVAASQTSKIKPSLLEEVSTKTAFNSLVRSVFPSLTLREAKESILRTESLLDLFENAGLLRFFGG